MIRARSGEKRLVLGLSAENVRLLQAGHPIRASLAEIGFDIDLLILYGKTEAAIARELGVDLAGPQPNEQAH